MGKTITMTATECAREMSRLGIKTTSTKVVNGIAGGAYPFGRIINESELRRCVEIFRVDFDAWLKSKIPEGFELEGN